LKATSNNIGFKTFNSFSLFECILVFKFKNQKSFMGFFRNIGIKISNLIFWALITIFLIVLTPIILGIVLGILAFVFLIVAFVIIIVFIIVSFFILLLALVGDEKTLKEIHKELKDW